jgi:AcrR family transcriptional regulator
MQKASERSKTATPTSKEPRTERGRRTLRAILDAAAAEFGERGFHETGITHITQRAGVALGTFYTYFDSKEEVFRALVKDMSGRVSQVGAQAVEGVTGTLAAERAVLAAFVAFASAHKELYRIIDEAEFVEPEAWRAHYEGAALRIRTRLERGAAGGELRADVGEVEAWALMGMNVFLGLRFGVWGGDMAPDEVARRANALVADGLRASSATRSSRA